MQQNIETKLTNVGNVIAHIFAPEHDQSALNFNLIKRSEHATTLKVTFEGKAGIVKVFAPGRDAKHAFMRERQALEIFHNLDTPRLLFVAEAEQLIMTNFIAGTPLLGTVTSDNIHQVSEHLGQWFGRLSNNAPKEAYHGNWADYLEQYKGGFEDDILDQQRPVLEGSPIGHLVLSHNDNALSNFILGAGKRLYGVDFEDTRMKPEGWDLATCARALFGQMPGSLPTIASSLLRGYQLAAKECTLPRNFDQVISTIALARALVSA